MLSMDGWMDGDGWCLTRSWLELLGWGSVEGRESEVKVVGNDRDLFSNNVKKERGWIQACKVRVGIVTFFSYLFGGWNWIG